MRAKQAPSWGWEGKGVWVLAPESGTGRGSAPRGVRPGPCGPETASKERHAGLGLTKSWNTC